MVMSTEPVFRLFQLQKYASDSIDPYSTPMSDIHTFLVTTKTSL